MPSKKINIAKKDLSAFNTYRQVLSKSIEDLLKDDSIPLEIRWNLFKETPADLCKYERYDQTNILFGRNVDAYDDFYKERYETIDVVDIVDSIEESQEGERKFKFKKDLDDIKTRILNKNIRKYKYDW